MEVTNENFSKAYRILEDGIENADFIAIDAEFSGLSTLRYKVPGYDTLEEMYEKTRIGSGKMLLLQYGVCLFTWIEEKKHYEAVPLAFYIFPRPYKKFGNDVMFTAQSSSLDFLAHHGFDFNKLFHKGISFMTPRAEEQARGNIEKEMEFFIEKEKRNVMKTPAAESSGASKVFIPKDQREFIDSVCETVKTFIKDDKHDTVDLPPSTPFQRKLIYERLEELYPLGLYLESATNEESQKFIRAHKTLAGYKKNVEEKFKNEQKMLEEVVGFTKVMKLLSKSRKPIIGHNMFKDLFLSFSNFFGEPPLTFKAFKESITDLFPIIIDTKVISSIPPLSHVLSHTGLGNLVKDIDEGNLPDPNVIMSESIKEETGFSERFHDAGYDAFSTGRVFLSVTKHVLTHACQPTNHADECQVTNRLDLSSDSLSKYINCVYIMGIRDIDNTDLSKEDTIPDRHNVFYIQFPPAWKLRDIKQLFSPYCSVDVFINWINEKSAFVTINDDDKYDDIFKNLVMSSGDDNCVSVLPYKYYIRNTDPNTDPRVQDKPSVEAVPSKKKRVSSDIEDGEIDSDTEEED